MTAHASPILSALAGGIGLALAVLRFIPRKESPMLPIVASFLLQVVPAVVRLINKYGGIKGFLAAEQATIRAVRKLHADWTAAKALTSDGGKTVTVAEAMVIAADAATVIEDAVGPLIDVAPGTDLGTFGDELLMEVAPLVFRLLTHQDLATVIAASKSTTTTP